LRSKGGWPGAVALSVVLVTALSRATQLTPLFPKEAETEAVTLFFRIAYSALALSILLAGVVQQFFSLKTTAVGFAVGIALLVAVAVVLLRR